jgi:hypothetical protein
MAKDIDFSGPHLKTERANHHIRELERIFKIHIAANQKALVPKYNRKPRTVIGTRFPKHTPTILGDALHNLRSALDHAYCILVEANGGTVNKHTKFPFTEKGSRKELEDSAKAHAEKAGGPSDKIIAVVFDDIQPYPGGKGADLIKLHVLDIADKHMMLLPTEQRTEIRSIRTTSGNMIVGCVSTNSADGDVVIGPGEGLDPDHDNKATFNICFGRGKPYEGEPILPVLKGLAARVHETLRLLEQRASETT